MSTQFLKATITYDNNCGSDNTEVFYICENNSIDYRKVITEDGKEPICSGTDWYCDALAHVLAIEDSDDTLHKVVIEECGWKGLPDNIKKIFDYKLYRKENPLKLKQYDENSSIKIYRIPIPEWVKDEERWLEGGSQPFDYIIEEDGVARLCPPKVCPICGSRNVSEKGFNDLQPQYLAGSAGYIETCNDCGYSHTTITVMS